MRDAISLLDQLSAYGGDSITRELVQVMLGAVSVEPLADLMDAVIRGDLKGALGVVGELVDQGLDPRQLTAELLDYVRDLLQVKAGNTPSLTAAEGQTEARMRAQAETLRVEDLLRLSRLLTQASLEIKGNILPQLPLELALTEAIVRPEAVPAPAPQPKLASRFATPTAGPQQEPEPKAAVQQAQPTAPEPSREERPAAPAASAAPMPTAAPVGPSAEGALGLEAVYQRWDEFVESLRNGKPRALALSVQALLRSGAPLRVEGGVVVIGFPSEFHRSKVGEDASRSLVEKALAETLGVPQCTIRGVVVSAQELKAAEAARLGRKGGGQPRRAPGAAVSEDADPIVEYAASRLGAVVKPILGDESSSDTEEETP